MIANSTKGNYTKFKGNFPIFRVRWIRIFWGVTSEGLSYRSKHNIFQQVSKKNQELSFYSIPEFEEWKSSTEGSKSWKVKYYKGLGTSTPKEAKEYFADMDRHRITFSYDGLTCDEAILMVSVWLMSYLVLLLSGIHNFMSYYIPCSSLNFCFRLLARRRYKTGKIGWLMEWRKENGGDSKDFLRSVLIGLVYTAFIPYQFHDLADSEWCAFPLLIQTFKRCLS